MCPSRIRIYGVTPSHDKTAVAHVTSTYTVTAHTRTQLVGVTPATLVPCSVQIDVATDVPRCTTPADGTVFDVADG